MGHGKPTNDQIAEVLNPIADLLEAKRADYFRIQAYRSGAQTVRRADEPLANMVQERGEEALEGLPDIGEGIASVIASYVRRGRSDVLERLKGEVAPEDLFTQVPGIGDELARRIADELEVSTLEELEEAAHDGRLQGVEGLGPERVRNLRVSLAGMLSTAAQRRRRRAGGAEEPKRWPSVEALLDVDTVYRRKAEEGSLRKIAPKRFNPEGEAWLSIFHTKREGWEFTALYSNTKRAHDLDKTDDWVVLYYKRDGEDGQATVVTETGGGLAGKRVVRGRESECRRFYDRSSSAEQ